MPQTMIHRVEDIITAERFSPLKEDFIKDVIRKGSQFKTDTEATFRKSFMELFVKAKRTVKNQGDHANEDITEQLYEKAWEKDHLKGGEEGHIKTECVPSLELEDQEMLAKYFKTHPKIKKPVPDVYYGLHKDAFTYKELAINMAHGKYTHLTTDDSRYIFFTMQFKSDKGSMYLGEQQTCRDGSATVSAMRRLRMEAGLPGETQGASDLDFTFSAVVDPVAAHLWVHWIATDPVEGTHYNMAHWNSYPLNLARSLMDLHHDIDNILEWGTVDRKTRIKELLAHIDQK